MVSIASACQKAQPNGKKRLKSGYKKTMRASRAWPDGNP